MTVVLRADSSLDLGSGHVARCMTLADGLRSRGVEPVFVCRLLPGSLVGAIRAEGFTCLELPAELDDADGEHTMARLESEGIRPDWLVVDSYELDAMWERRFRAAGARIVVIDDLADRAHECELLLDVSCLPADADRYSPLVPAECTILAGPAHALLRREFTDSEPATPRSTVSRVLVFFGGADSSDETAVACEALVSPAADGLEVAVVHGSGYAGASMLAERFGSRQGFRIIGPTHDMARHMREADLALGACGSTTWERCYEGLPAVSSVIAPNQETTARTADRLNIAVSIARAGDRSEEYLREVRGLMANPADLRSMSESCLAIRATMRPARRHVLIEDLLARGVERRFALRAVEPSDSGMLRSWRNHPEVRESMRIRHHISDAEHAEWMTRILASSERRAWVFEAVGEPAGFVNVARPSEENRSAEWGLYVAPGLQGRRLGKAMGLLALDEAFDDLGLASVTAEVIRDNIPSTRLHIGLGFRPDEAVALDSGLLSLVLTKQAWGRIRSRVAGAVYARCAE